MPIDAAGAPLNREWRSDDRAPISTRATSLIRTTEPLGFVRSTMLANSSGCVSRPFVLIVNCSCCSLVTGAAPMRPSAAWTF
jgi:hypothetical protein